MEHRGSIQSILHKVPVETDSPQHRAALDAFSMDDGVRPRSASSQDVLEGIDIDTMLEGSRGQTVTDSAISEAQEEDAEARLPTAGEPASLGPPASPQTADDPSPVEPELGETSEPTSQTEPGPGEAVREEDRDLDWVVWSSDDVSEWIDLLLGDGTGEPFRRNKVDGPTLLELTEDDLRTCLEIGNPLHRQKIMGHVRVFQMRRARLAQHAARRRLAEIPRPASTGQDSSPASQTQEVPQNGHTLNYGPPPRKKQGRVMGQSASVDRLYSASSKLSHSPTEASSISVDSHAMSDDERGGFVTSNRFSRFTNPSRCYTTGLISCFGLDSPSFSLRGSWPTAPVRREGAERLGPGPCSYNVVSNLEKVENRSPRATIGNSYRNVSEHFVSDNHTLGGGKFNQKLGRAKVKGGIIGTAPRWGASNARFLPGPATYRPRDNFRSNFK